MKKLLALSLGLLVIGTALAYSPPDPVTVEKKEIVYSPSVSLKNIEVYQLHVTTVMAENDVIVSYVVANEVAASPTVTVLEAVPDVGDIPDPAAIIATNERTYLTTKLPAPKITRLSPLLHGYPPNGTTLVYRDNCYKIAWLTDWFVPLE